MLKNFIRQICLILFFTSSSISLIYAKMDYQIEEQFTVVEIAQQIEQFGILKQKANGYLYVDVSNDFIATLLPLIEASGKLVPPKHYTSKKGIGAHISVIYENELLEHEIWEIAELGQVFTFQVKELRTVKLNKDGKLQKLWLLAVEAPELEHLREGYGLASKLKGHDFHITLAYQVPGKASRQEAAPKIEILFPVDQDQEELELEKEAA